MSEKETSIYKTRVTLLEKLKDKYDDSAWTDFSLYYRNYLYNIARRMRLNNDDANEIVQLVLLKVWNKLGGFHYDSEKGRFRGWLCRITGNEIRNFFRANRKGRLLYIEECKTESGFTDLEPFTQAEVEKAADDEWKEYLPKLAWKIIQENFDENAQKTFEMLLSGKKPEEIAKLLGVSRNTVYTHKKRISDRLKREIGRLEKELG
jgi:RNA polymerase sigma factor (sigma-70 family)